MPISIQNNQLKEILSPKFNPGLSYTLEEKSESGGFLAPGSAVETWDINSQLFQDIIEWKMLPINPLSIQLLEVQEWERIIAKLNVLELVAGMLNELTSEQMEIFEEAVQRRPFF
jgi:hypothetical protein